MKKLFFVLAMSCMASFTGIAQEAKWGVGVNVGYGTDVSAENGASPPTLNGLIHPVLPLNWP